MVTIEKNTKRLTLINVFVVENAQRQDSLIATLEEVTLKVMRFLPGFVSASVHRGHDERHIVNYAQWESMESFQSMLGRVDVKPHMRRVKELAQSITPVLYDIAFTCDRSEVEQSS